MPLLLVRNADRARKLLMQAFGIEGGERVGIPANTRRPLSEAVKRSGGTPYFLELDANLDIATDTPGLDDLRLVWSQPVGGMPAPAVVPGTTMFVDYAFTLPVPLDVEAIVPGAAVIWGLHLAEKAADAGALIAFPDGADLYHAVSDLMQEDDLPNLDLALRQCERLAGPDGITARQLAKYRAARVGMEAGAGLPMPPDTGLYALPYGLPVRVPEDADMATFISYVRNENVVVYWLPELQPMFYVVRQVTADAALTRRTARHLAQWLIAPLGPDFVDDEIVHAVLGILKAAEYTGVRWYTDPARARWYGDLMFEWYGPTHDAYRVAFEIPADAVVLA
jgi:hypothetical protein